MNSMFAFHCLININIKNLHFYTVKNNIIAIGAHDTMIPLSLGPLSFVPGSLFFNLLNNNTKCLRETHVNSTDEINPHSAYTFSLI